MTVRVERTFDLSASPDRVWEFIADPGKRASAISIVADWTIDDGDATWYLELPIPLIKQTVPVRTRDVEREEETRVKFVGKSAVMHVTGEHELIPTESGTRLVNRFVVEGRVPGVERFFKHNIDSELDNLRDALERHLAAEA